MEENNLYSLFHILSRIIVVFAIIVLIMGLMIRFNQNSPKIQSSITNQKPTIAIPMTQSNSVKISTSALELNLTGPFVCHFSSPEATISAYVKDNNAYGQIKERMITSNILLKGDCVYFWKTSLIGGQKLCGLSQYISIFGNMPLGNLLQNNQLLSMLPLDVNKIPLILNSCKKAEIKDNNIFTLPQGINFKLLSF